MLIKDDVYEKVNETNSRDTLVYPPWNFKVQYDGGNLYIPIYEGNHVFYLTISHDILKRIVKDIELDLLLESSPNNLTFSK